MRSPSTSTALVHEAFLLPPSEGYPLSIAAKRYFPPLTRTTISGPPEDERALTLLFLHSTSFHQETWEATIEDLFDLIKANGRRPEGVAIRDVWVVECPNHGGSAALNQDLLPAFGDFTCERYAFAVHRFLTHSTSPFNASTRLITVVGHSLGGVTATFLPMFCPVLPIASLILADPILAPDPPGIGRYDALRNALVSHTVKRTWIWPSRERAYEDIKKDGRTRFDERVLRALVTHGVRPSRTHEGSVELACTREQEVIMYVDKYGPTDSMPALARLSQQIPIHAVFGSRSDFVPCDVQDALVDPASPRRFASVTRIEGVGHLVPQEKPGELAQIILDCLIYNRSKVALGETLPTLRSKL